MNLVIVFWLWRHDNHTEWRKQVSFKVVCYIHSFIYYDKSGSKAEKDLEVFGQLRKLIYFSKNKNSTAKSWFSYQLKTNNEQKTRKKAITRTSRLFWGKFEGSFLLDSQKKNVSGTLLVT